MISIYLSLSLSPSPLFSISFPFITSSLPFSVSLSYFCFPFSSFSPHSSHPYLFLPPLPSSPFKEIREAKQCL